MNRLKIVYRLSNIFSAGVYRWSVIICENDIFVYFYVIKLFSKGPREERDQLCRVDDAYVVVCA